MKGRPFLNSIYQTQVMYYGQIGSWLPRGDCQFGDQHPPLVRARLGSDAPPELDHFLNLSAAKD